MNKKAKLYSINNKTLGLKKIKENQNKSNQKLLLSKSVEKRNKKDSSVDQNLDGLPKISYHSKKVKISSNNNRNQNAGNSKEYANTLTLNKKEEENIKSSEKPIKLDILNNNTYNEKQNLKEKNKANKYNNNVKSEKKVKKKLYENKNEDMDYSDEEEEEKENNDDDILYRTLYRSSNKKLDSIKEKEEIIKKNKEKKIIANNQNNNDNNDNLIKKNFIEMEQTENLIYNIDDKKIYSNSNNNKIKIPKKLNEPKSKRDSNKSLENYNYNNYALSSPKNKEKKSIENFYDYITQKTINLYIIDDDFDTKVYSKLNKKISRKNNKFREILIEKYEKNAPLKKEKFTGFIFIRKSKGKKIYTLELPDNIEQINNIFKNENIMIKNQIIQIAPLSAQNESKKSLNEKNLEKEIDKHKDIIKDKERQIILLKNKNEELNNTIKKQNKQISQYEKDITHIKNTNDQLQDTFQNLDKENKSLKSQLQAYKIRRKSIQMQIEESSNPSLLEMKDRIQKYKNELRKNSCSIDDRLNRKSVMNIPCNINISQGQGKTSNKKEEQEKETEEQNLKNNEDEENYQDDYNYDIYDENDPKARKMKKAMARFRKKYKDVIIENKRNLKLKEKEEREKEENERKELEGISIQDSKKLFNEKEERERKEKEEKEKKEKEEKERREKEEKEKERREKERKEREKREKERKERERKEREKREKERKEKEEKERKERERKEKEKERKEKEEKEKKEKEEKEKKEKERKEKEEKEKKDKDKKSIYGGIPNKLMAGNFSKMLADKMKMGPMGGGLRKSSQGNDYNSKLPILHKKVDVINLIEEQPFKRKNKKKPTRKMFVE